MEWPSRSQELIGKLVYGLGIHQIHGFYFYTANSTQVGLRFVTSLAGTTTVAPAAASVLVVSSPMPVLPPVTIAIFPLRSMPWMTSSVVDVALNPEPIGCCNAP